MRQKKTRKLLSVTLTAALVLSMSGVMAFATEADIQEDTSEASAEDVALSMAGTADLSGELEIINVELPEPYTEGEATYYFETTTGQQTAVQAFDYYINGEEGRAEVSGDYDHEALTLVVNGMQEEIKEGATYDGDIQIVCTEVTKIGGPSAAPWSGAADEAKSTFYFRQALLIDDSAINYDASVTEAISGGSYDDSEANGVCILSNGSFFNGIYVTGDSDYTIEDSEIYAYGDGGDDFSGWGAGIMADGSGTVDIDSTYIETAGTIRTAIWVGGHEGATANITNSVVYAQETQDDYDTYQALVPSMMKRVPFALGMEGVVRATNVLGDAQANYSNCLIVSSGWGALSTDSGSAYDQTGRYALTVEDSIAGIGSVTVGEEGETDTFYLDDVAYGFTMGGSGYVTYADAGVHNYYDNVKFYSPDYVMILASGDSSGTYEESELYSNRIAFMTQQAGGGTLTIENGTEVTTRDALLQIKGGEANTGYTNFVINGSTVNFTGDSKRTDAGILVELVESDDAGNPGVTTYTISDTGDTAERSSVEYEDSTATFENGDYTGDIWNSIYYGVEALDVTLQDNANLTGMISSSVAIHVDPETGDVVENGTVLNAYMGSEEADIADYRDPENGTTGDYLIVGSFQHTANPVDNNPINLTIDDSSVWNITGDCYLNELDIADDSCLVAADGPVEISTIYMTEDGSPVDDGTYTYDDGNVTVIVDSSLQPEVADTGMVANGTTYGLVDYAFYAMDADGNPISDSVSLIQQNWTDGNVYFTVMASDGYEIVDTAVDGGEVEAIGDDSDPEVSDYESVLVVEEGVPEVTVTFIVQ